MQFLVMAYDGTDAEAPNRRISMRQAHLKGVRSMKESENFLEGGAILDDAGAMIGSAMIVEFSSRDECDAWIASDPYTVGKVWDKVDVKPFRRAPV